MKEEGPLSLYRGTGLNLIRYGTNQAFLFTFNKFFQKQFKIKEENNKARHLIKSLLSGGVSGAISIGMVYPLEML
jgi:solute carrier family 25 (adenine nucleotide translocator) protein 4/5/6/31